MGPLRSAPPPAAFPPWREGPCCAARILLDGLFAPTSPSPHKCHAQITVGDIIFAVNGETVTGLPVHEVVYKIKGEPGSEVHARHPPPHLPSFPCSQAPPDPPPSPPALQVSMVFIKKSPTAPPPQPVSPTGMRPPSMVTPGQTPVLPPAPGPMYPSDRERMLDQQLDNVKRVQQEQEQRERMLRERQAVLMRREQEVSEQKVLAPADTLPSTHARTHKPPLHHPTPKLSTPIPLPLTLAPTPHPPGVASP